MMNADGSDSFFPTSERTALSPLRGNIRLGKPCDYLKKNGGVLPSRKRRRMNPSVETGGDELDDNPLMQRIENIWMKSRPEEKRTCFEFEKTLQNVSIPTTNDIMNRTDTTTSHGGVSSESYDSNLPILPASSCGVTSQVSCAIDHPDDKDTTQLCDSNQPKTNTHESVNAGLDTNRNPVQFGEMAETRLLERGDVKPTAITGGITTESASSVTSSNQNREHISGDNPNNNVTATMESSDKSSTDVSRETSVKKDEDETRCMIQMECVDNSNDFLASIELNHIVNISDNKPPKCIEQHGIDGEISKFVNNDKKSLFVKHESQFNEPSPVSNLNIPELERKHEVVSNSLTVGPKRKVDRNKSVKLTKQKLQNVAGNKKCVRRKVSETSVRSQRLLQQKSAPVLEEPISRTKNNVIPPKACQLFAGALNTKSKRRGRPNKLKANQTSSCQSQEQCLLNGNNSVTKNTQTTHSPAPPGDLCQMAAEQSVNMTQHKTICTDLCDIAEDQTLNTPNLGNLDNDTNMESNEWIKQNLPILATKLTETPIRDIGPRNAEGSGLPRRNLEQSRKLEHSSKNVSALNNDTSLSNQGPQVFEQEYLQDNSSREHQSAAVYSTSVTRRKPQSQIKHDGKRLNCNSDKPEHLISVSDYNNTVGDTGDKSPSSSFGNSLPASGTAKLDQPTEKNDDTSDYKSPSVDSGIAESPNLESVETVVEITKPDQIPTEGLQQSSEFEPKHSADSQDDVSFSPNDLLSALDQKEEKDSVSAIEVFGDMALGDMTLQEQSVYTRVRRKPKSTKSLSTLLSPTLENWVSKKSTPKRLISATSAPVLRTLTSRRKKSKQVITTASSPTLDKWISRKIQSNQLTLDVASSTLDNRIPDESVNCPDILSCDGDVKTWAMDSIVSVTGRRKRTTRQASLLDSASESLPDESASFEATLPDTRTIVLPTDDTYTPSENSSSDASASLSEPEPIDIVSGHLTSYQQLLMDSVKIQFDDDDGEQVLTSRKGAEQELHGSVDVIGAENETDASESVVEEVVFTPGQRHTDQEMIQCDLQSNNSPFKILHSDTVPTGPARKKSKRPRRSADFEIMNTIVALSPILDLSDFDDMPTIPVRRSRRIRRKSTELYRAAMQKSRYQRSSFADSPGTTSVSEQNSPVTPCQSGFMTDQDSPITPRQTPPLCDEDSPVTSCQSSSTCDSTSPVTTCQPSLCDKNIPVSTCPSSHDDRPRISDETPEQSLITSVSDDVVSDHVKCQRDFSTNGQVATAIISEPTVHTETCETTSQNKESDTSSPADAGCTSRKRRRVCRKVTQVVPAATAPVARKRKQKPEPSLEDIYQNKLWKSQMPKEKTWETIYELPQTKKSGTEEYQSSKRQKRIVNFDDIYTQTRRKRRRQKALKQGWHPMTKKKSEKMEMMVYEKLFALDQEMKTETEDSS